MSVQIESQNFGANPEEELEQIENGINHIIVLSDGGPRRRRVSYFISVCSFPVCTDEFTGEKNEWVVPELKYWKGDPTKKNRDNSASSLWAWLLLELGWKRCCKLSWSIDLEHITYIKDCLRETWASITIKGLGIFRRALLEYRSLFKKIIHTAVTYRVMRGVIPGGFAAGIDRQLQNIRSSYLPP